MIFRGRELSTGEMGNFHSALTQRNCLFEILVKSTADDSMYPKRGQSSKVQTSSKSESS